MGNSFLLAKLYEYDVKNVTIPYSVNFYGNMAIEDYTSLTSIKYNGTKEEWEELPKEPRWNLENENYVILAFLVILTNNIIIMQQHIKKVSNGRKINKTNN